MIPGSLSKPPPSASRPPHRRLVSIRSATLADLRRTPTSRVDRCRQPSNLAASRQPWNAVARGLRISMPPSRPKMRSRWMQRLSRPMSITWSEPRPTGRGLELIRAHASRSRSRVDHGDSLSLRLPASILRSAQYARIRSATACRFFGVGRRPPPPALLAGAVFFDFAGGGNTFCLVDPSALTPDDGGFSEERRAGRRRCAGSRNGWGSGVPG